MTKSGKLAIIGYALMGISFIVSAVSGKVNEKQQDAVIEEKVMKVLAAKNQ